MSCSILRRKLRHNVFWLKILLFFKNLCFQQPLGSEKKSPISSTVTVKITFEPIQIVPWGLSHSKLREKISQNLFCTGEIASFPKICVFKQPLRCYENAFYNFHSNCQISCLTLTKCFLRFVALDNTRKNMSNSFVPGKRAFFWKTWFPTS